jgi:hypothetical protein
MEKTNKENDIIRKEVNYDSKNTPNAKILISALQHIGYENTVAICDIIDNSIDADSTRIQVFIEEDNEKQLRIIIADNGTGMEYEVLDEALKLGSNSEHSESADLGKFGMGLSTAGLSLANRTTVLTKEINTPFLLKSVTDVDVIKESNDFVKYIGNANQAEEIFFENIVDNDTGTVIIFEKCSGITNKNTKQFANKLVKEMARIYRKYMNRITFEVNGERVMPYDPLMLDEEEGFKSEIFSDEDYDVKWKDSKTGEIKSGVVHVKLVLLQAYNEEFQKNRDINMKNQGFSVLRNNREIAFGFVPKDWFNKHPNFNRVRGELSFDSELDEPMGVNFTKNGIDMVDSIDNSLRNDLLPQMRAMSNQTRKTAKISEEEISSHKEAEKVINNKSKLLITPVVKKEKRDTNKEKEKIKQREQGNKENLQDRERKPKKMRDANANVEFRTAKNGRLASIFEAWQEGKKIIIEWNTEHPFYDRFVIENKDNQHLVTSVDFLIYSLATAQIQAMGDDEDKAIMVENIISTMSTNMRALLS